MSYLLVPIHLDALCLKEELPVTEAMADFSRLPYTDGKELYNENIPYVSDSILSDPPASRRSTGLQPSAFCYANRGAQDDRQSARQSHPLMHRYDP